MSTEPAVSSNPTAAASSDGRFAFGEFAVDAGQRTLTCRGAVVALPSRAFDTLVYLIEHRDRCVHKDELIAAIWNDVVVTDDSLIHAISVLRRVLGDERHEAKYIQTIPRRGYRFVAAIDRAWEPRPGTSGERRNPGFPGGWMAAAGGALAVLAAWFVLGFDGPTAGRDAGAPIQLYQPAPPGTRIVSGGVLSPDGSYLAFVAHDESEWTTALWVRALDSSELVRLEGTEGAAKPFWAPDSRRLGYFASGKLLATAIDGGGPREIAPAFAAAGGAWSADDTILFADWASGLFAVPATGDGEVETIVSLDRNAHDIAFAWPQFFPDSRRFLYQIVSLDAERSGIHVADMATRKSFKLLDSASPATLAPPNYLLHVDNGMLIAEELDSGQAALTGRASIVARDISEPTLAADNLVSASAGLLAFQQGQTTQNLAWFDRGGEPLGALAMPTELYNSRISPNGRQLLGSSLVTTNPGLWMVSLDRAEFARLETDAIGPVWSPDGERIAFTSRDGFEILVRAIGQDEQPRRLVSDANVKVLNDWTRDGSGLIYTQHHEATGLDLWIFDLATESSRPLLATPFSETQARVSPDGQWIAYASDESGLLQTYVARLPEFRDRQMVSSNGGGQPQWRSDQGELFYLALDRSVMAAAVETHDPIRFGAPSRLFRAAVAGDPPDARDYFAADHSGARFLVDSAVRDSGVEAITIMVDWAAGLPARRDGPGTVAP